MLSPLHVDSSSSLCRARLRDGREIARDFRRRAAPPLRPGRVQVSRLGGDRLSHTSPKERAVSPPHNHSPKVLSSLACIPDPADSGKRSDCGRKITSGVPAAAPRQDDAMRAREMPSLSPPPPTPSLSVALATLTFVYFDRSSLPGASRRYYDNGRSFKKGGRGRALSCLSRLSFAV